MPARARCSRSSRSWTVRMSLRPRVEVVHRAARGHPRQIVPKVTLPLLVIGRVRPARQVAVGVSSSMVKSSIVIPPGTAARNGIDLTSATLPALPIATSIGSDPLVESPRTSTCVTGAAVRGEHLDASGRVAVLRPGPLQQHGCGDQAGVGFRDQMPLEAVLSFLPRLMHVAGINVDGGDHQVWSDLPHDPPPPIRPVGAVRAGSLSCPATSVSNTTAYCCRSSSTAPSTAASTVFALVARRETSSSRAAWSSHAISGYPGFV